MDLDDRLLSPTETLLEPGSIVQYVGVHCTPDGNWVPLEDSAIRLSLMPWLRNLVLLYYCGAEGWQYDWLGSFDGPLTLRLCLHQLPCMCGTTDHLP